MAEDPSWFWNELCEALSIHAPPPALNFDTPSTQGPEVGPLAIATKRRKYDASSEHVNPRALLNDAREMLDDYDGFEVKKLTKRRRRDVGLHFGDSTFVPIPPNITMPSALAIVRNLMNTDEIDTIIREAQSTKLAIPGVLPTAWQNPIDSHFQERLIEECQAPIRAVRDDLINLYFLHIHTVFPIIDEYALTNIYHRYKNDEAEMMKHVDLILFQAAMFVAFAHINETQLARTPYKTVHEGQEAQFRKVKALYRSRITTDPYILTQVCLLLSFWSPCDSEFQVNSYWVERAFHHAREAMLSDSRFDNRVKNCRRKVLWWCCMIRDRMLACGMRRPHRLQAPTSTRALPVEEDFGLEVVHPSFTTVDSKKIQISTFVWFCRLSNIMASMAVFQRSVKFAHDWNGESIDVDIDEIQQVMKFEKDLKTWRREFDSATAMTVNQSHQKSTNTLVYILRLVNDSLLANLYSPYIHYSSFGPHPSKHLGNAPVEQVKASAHDVARHLQNILAINKMEAIPLFVVAWIALPAAVDYVAAYIYPTSTEDYTSLKHVLYNLGSRYQGALALSWWLDRATGSPVPKVREPSPDEVARISYLKSNDQHLMRLARSRDISPEATVFSSEKTEAQLLDCVANLVEFHLQNDILGDKRVAVL